MQSVRSLRFLPTSDISAFIEQCDLPYEPSELYSTATSSNLTDKALRCSESRTLVDSRLFALCEPLVRAISQSDGAYEYTLAPDNLTHIRYTHGGFFSRHTDHCRALSNIIEEFTLILNVNPDGITCRGGATLIHHPTDDGGTSSVVFETTAVPGGGETIACCRCALRTCFMSVA